jgi:hypothetical protein
MRHVVHLSADQLFTRPAKEGFGSRIDMGHEAMGVYGIQAFSHVVHDSLAVFREVAKPSFPVA